ncbi:MAG TPA: hypothetical protein VMW95_08610 [Desulfobacterales bacterium]|nr:hypothetical protein [Desulfobacterales bacterium]
MALESKPGSSCKVTLGANTILGIGSWSITGGSFAALDDTAFGDDSTQIMRGIRTGGNVSFTGKYKKDDTTGQEMIKTAYWAKSDLTDLRFYVDAASYYTPNSTTAAGGGLPAETQVSHIKIMTEPNFTADINNLITVDFSGVLDGAMRLI